jgi:hypothetical protein
MNNKITSKPRKNCVFPLLLFLTILCMGTSFSGYSQTEFALEPRQSMLMTGKGPGQNGTINPFDGEDCYAIVENFGEGTFSVRIQKNGEILQTIYIPKGETQKILLLKDQELYLDSEERSEDYPVKARVDYAKKED